MNIIGSTPPFTCTRQRGIFSCAILRAAARSLRRPIFSGVQDKEDEKGRDARVTLVTCVAGKNEERLAIEADAEQME